jgi:hypothetical protein
VRFGLTLIPLVTFRFGFALRDVFGDKRQTRSR